MKLFDRGLRRTRRFSDNSALTRRAACSAFVLVALGIGASPGRAADAPHEPVYLVKKGETLQAIAREHQVSEHAVRVLNGLGRGEGIRPGQKLAIPAPDEEPAPPPSSPAPTARDGSSATRASVSHGRTSVRLVRGTETVAVSIFDRRGRVTPTALAQFEQELRFTTGATHKPDPRLVAVVARVSEHFGGRDIIVVSGFRPYSSSQFTAHSNHNIGRAIDFMVRGIANEKVRDFCRAQHNVGVGYYPNSSFIHLDVRSSNAYWIDFAGPGQRPRYHRGEAGQDADEGAGEVPLDVVQRARLRPGDVVSSGHDATELGSSETQDASELSRRSGKGNFGSSDSTGEPSVFPGKK